MSENQIDEYDVIIVGAGLAGLAAAKVVQEEGKSFVILEATDRSGGKVHSKVSEDSSRYFELGAQFVNKEMTEITKLIEQAGMDLNKTDIPEDVMVISDKSKEPIHLDFNDITETLGAIDGAHSDSKPVNEIIDRHISNKRKRQVLKSFLAAETTVNSEHINAKAIRKLISRITTASNALNYQASGPLSRVIDYLEGSSQDAVHYLEPVVKVKETQTGYVLKTTNKTKYYGKAVILAVPPTAAAQIKFSPALTERYERYLNSYTNGAVIKMTFVYDRPFWREMKIKGKKKALYGVIYSAHEGVNLMDSSKDEGENRLTLYIGGNKARELADVPVEIEEFFANERLIEVFGEEAENYIDYEISEWLDSPYYGGGFGAMIHAGGEADAAERLKEPFNRLVFASTELAPEFAHFMEGAIRSGRYAAKQLIKELNTDEKD